MDENRLPKIILHFKREEHRDTGRPKQDGKMNSIEDGIDQRANPLSRRKRTKFLEPRSWWYSSVT
jgi:hypothetical protein